jgi:hypothetical protein
MKAPLLSFLLILFVVLLSTLPSVGQRLYPGVRVYRTVEYNQTAMLRDSLFVQRNSGANKQIKRKAIREAGEVITVGVVFHVLHQGGLFRVSEDQLYVQLEALNRDFNALNIPSDDERDPQRVFRSQAANPKIRFCFPDNNKLGQLRGGRVNYRHISQPLSSSDWLIKDKGLGATPIKPKQYLNIWITQLSDSIAGYAQYPGGSEKIDGIVIDPRYLANDEASPYSQGKTLTHLVANYLGLPPIWGRGGCSDDGIQDTPAHNAPNYGRPDAGHSSTCAGYPAEMTMNFMDSAEDEMLYMFTRRQVARMRAALSPGGLREKLGKVSTQCTPPQPEFALNRNAASTTSQTSPASSVLTVHPNPSDGEVRINFRTDDAMDDFSGIRIYDLKGGLMYETQEVGFKISRGTVAVDAQGWPPGVYVVHLTTDSQQYTERFSIY